MLSEPVFQIGIAGGRVTACGTELEEPIHQLRDSFQKANHARLPGLLSESTLEVLDRYIGDTAFESQAYPDVGRELRAELGGAPHYLLTLLVHHPRLFELVRAVTGCGRIGCFDGRVSRLMPGHSFDWHSDFAPDVLVGMSINIGQGHYRGGDLQIRDSTGAITKVANARRGDAVLFPIRSGLQHRITAVEGNVPRTAFSGWFESEPDSPLLFSVNRFESIPDHPRAESN